MSAGGPTPDADRDLRHTVEQTQLHQEAMLRAALARTAGEWFDIFVDITSAGVRQTLELSLPPGEATAEFDRKMTEQKPYFRAVRADFESHGLPLTDEIEIEGPEVRLDAAGMPHIVEWPRGVWIEFIWPQAGSKGDRLRFMGQKAIVALAFIQWWTSFHTVAQRMAGIEGNEQRRIIDPNSPEYKSYFAAKAKDQRG